MSDEMRDYHCPSRFVPAHYRYVVSYVFGHSFMPPINVDRAVQAMKEYPLFQHPTWGFRLGKCSVCGAHFNYGDLWLHEPSGELITVGHDCADKYSLLADRSAFELEVGNAKAARAAELLKVKKAEERAAFFAQHPGLESALECSHNIVQNIKSAFERWGNLSPRQIELVLKLAAEAAASKPVVVPEARVAAPEGRTEFTGLVVSAKDVDSQFGLQTKVTILVETPEGSWLAWGTCPAAILSETGRNGGPRGKRVAITATLKRGRDAHFALMSRPAGRLVEHTDDCERCLACRIGEAVL